MVSPTDDGEGDHLTDPASRAQSRPSGPIDHARLMAAYDQFGPLDFAIADTSRRQLGFGIVHVAKNAHIPTQACCSPASGAWASV